MQRRLSRLKFDGTDSPFFDRQGLLEEMDKGHDFLQSLIPHFVTVTKGLHNELKYGEQWGVTAPNALIDLYRSIGITFQLDDGSILKTPADEQWFSLVWPVIH